MNPFDLLGDDDNDDPSQFIAAQQQKLPPPSAAQKKAPAQAPAAKPAAGSKMPSKPLPPSQAGNFLKPIIYVCLSDVSVLFADRFYVCIGS